MPDEFDELAALVHKTHAAARERAAADLDRSEEREHVFDIVGVLLGKERQQDIQANRNNNCIENPVPTLMEIHEAVTERRVQMEADLDVANGDLLWCVMLADYGDTKAGDVVQVPRSEAGFIPCREATTEEVERATDPCFVPCVGDELRIAAMLHGVRR